MQSYISTTRPDENNIKNPVIILVKQLYAPSWLGPTSVVNKEVPSSYEWNSDLIGLITDRNSVRASWKKPVKLILFYKR